MDSWQKLWKKTKEDNAGWIVAGVVVIVGLLAWFVISVRAQQRERADTEQWSDVTDRRKDPTLSIYDKAQKSQEEASKRLQEDLKRLQSLPPAMRSRQEQQIRQMFQISMMMLQSTIEGEAVKIPERLAATTPEDLKALNDMVGRHERSPTGAWIYYHLGNIYYAKKDYEKALTSFKKAKALAAGVPGHVLTSKPWLFVDSDIKRAEQQQAWVTKLATKRQPVGNAKNNPHIEVVTEHGVAVIELFMDESPALVKALCKLVADGYYDGRRIYRDGGRIATGCPFGTGQGEVGPGLAKQITERTHGKGTISMEQIESGKHKDQVSSCRFFVMLEDVRSTDAGAGASEDGKNSIVGRVTTDAGVAVLAKLKVGQALLRVRLVDGKTGAFKPTPVVEWPETPKK